jgi:Xaa-Pro dipeptidase
MSSLKSNLLIAEKIAIDLFNEIENQNLVVPGKDELTLNEEIYELAKNQFDINKHWHKRIVRSGENTLYPYKENPPNRKLQDDDILFFDFGPIIDRWEADLGRTYVLGNNSEKIKIKNDIEKAWKETQEWFQGHNKLKSCELFEYATQKAIDYGWEFGGEIAGHLIGEFPHERLESENYHLYIHPESELDLFNSDENGKERYWILELHFINKKNKIGAFYEQIVNAL